MVHEEFGPSTNRINKHPENQSSVEVESTANGQFRNILKDLKGDQIVEPDGGDIILGEPRLIGLANNSPIVINKGETSVMAAVCLRAPWDEDDTIEIYEVRLASPRGGAIEHEWIIELDEDQVLIDRYVKQAESLRLTRPKNDELVANFLDVLELDSSMSGRDTNEPGQKEKSALLKLLQAYKGGPTEPS